MDDRYASQRLLACDHLVLQGPRPAEGSCTVLDDDGIELGRIVKEWVSSLGDERAELALYDLESTRVVACDHVEHRSRRFTYPSSVGITDGRGREVGNLVRGRSRWEIRIQDLSGQLLATIKPRLRAPTSFAIKDSTGTEVGDVHASPAVLKYELGDPRGGVERLTASVEVTINGSPASDLRLAVLGFAMHLLDLTGGALKARSRVQTSQRVERGPLRRLVDTAARAQLVAPAHTRGVLLLAVVVAAVTLFGAPMLRRSQQHRTIQPAHPATAAHPFPARTGFSNARVYAQAVTSWALSSGGLMLVGEPRCDSQATWTQWSCAALVSSYRSPRAADPAVPYRCRSAHTGGFTCELAPRPQATAHRP